MKTQSKRVAGFVVGSSRKGNGLVWTVRVKDSKSVHDGAKLMVVSIRPGNELRSSANVTFRVEPVLMNGEFVFKAAGVNVGKDLVDSDQPSVKDVAERSDTLNVCATVHLETGEVAVFCTGLENIDQARQECETDNTDKVIGFEAIDMAPADHLSETHTGLEVLRVLSFADGPREALDYLLTKSFRLGRSSHDS